MADVKIITPEFRVSYPHVFRPQKNDLNGKMEYSVVAVFAKATDISALKKAAESVLTEKFGADKAKWPANMRNPFRKCSERWKNVEGKMVPPAGYEDGDAVFMTLKATEQYKPGIVGPDMQDIIEPKDFYAGCFARASVRPYFYDQKGNKGVSFGLNNVQKLRDGDPLGGSSRPTDDFQAVEGHDDKTKGAGSVFD
jgi:hypothetical protein